MRSERADLTADVVVVGAGPAGAVAALMLAQSCRTLLVDRTEPAAASTSERMGESLPGAARRLLNDMGLWAEFEGQGHQPCFTRRSAWGAAAPTFADSLRDLDGPGWLLDRPRFDAWMREQAVRRGAALVAPARFTAVSRRAEGWRVTVERRGQPFTIDAQWLVDAGGRFAPVARKLRIPRFRGDRLVCRWIVGRCDATVPGLAIAAESRGWWYTAGLSEGRRVLAFHSDSDLVDPTVFQNGDALLGQARAHPHLNDLIADLAVARGDKVGVRAAHSVWLAEAVGRGWAAVGDAALACDPLSARGVFNALYTGFLGAGAIREAVSGDSSALQDYQRVIQALGDAYRRDLDAWYGLESRWLGAPFWERRRPRTREYSPGPRAQG